MTNDLPHHIAVSDPDPTPAHGILRPIDPPRPTFLLVGRSSLDPNRWHCWLAGTEHCVTTGQALASAMVASALADGRQVVCSTEHLAALLTEQAA